ALGKVGPATTRSGVPGLILGRVTLEELPGRGLSAHDPTGQALETVIVITTWPSAPARTNASSNALNTVAASPVTIVLMGPTSGRSPAASSARLTSVMVGVSRSCRSG